MRVIVRFSLDGDHGNLTSALATILKRGGLPKKKRTGTYEGSEDVSISSLKSTLDDFWDKIEGQTEAKLDHFWMYVDKRTTEASRKKSSRQRAT